MVQFTYSDQGMPQTKSGGVKGDLSHGFGLKMTLVYLSRS